MTTISTDPNMVTLVNIFTVTKGNQNALIALLNQATSEVMSRLPGFMSASFHRSHDGTKVMNYAQWESREAYESALQVPAAQDHMVKIKRMVEKVEPTLYSVDSVYEYHAIQKAEAHPQKQQDQAAH